MSFKESIFKDKYKNKNQVKLKFIIGSDYEESDD